MSFDSIEIPEEVFDRHFDTVLAPEPEGESDEPEDTDDDELVDPDTDEDEPGDDPDEADDEEEEDVEEDEDSETDDEVEPEDEDQDDEPLPKFDRKKIEKDPNLKAAYKHMQAAFTKKMQAASEVKNQAAEMVAEAQGVLDRHKEFVSMLADPKGAEEFLVKVAVNRPEVFQAAFDRASKLLEDPEEMKRFSKETEIAEREKKIKAKEAEDAKRSAERAKQVLRETTESVAAKVGLKSEADLKLAHRFVRARLQENLDLTGKSSITREEIVEVVKEAAETIQSKVNRARKEVVKDVQKKARKSASRRKRPGAPRSSSRPAGKKGRLDIPKGVDPLDHAVDVLLGD